MPTRERWAARVVKSTRSYRRRFFKRTNVMSGLATVFRDRTEAGRMLAARLASMGLIDPVVYALPRGGTPVAVEIARALEAPLDLLLVRKIGAPGQPEVALAAIVEGEQTPVV